MKSYKSSCPVNLLTFVSICFLNFLSFGQVANEREMLDSLLHKASDEYYAYNYKESLKYSARLVQLARELNYPGYQAEGYNFIGIIYESIDDIEKAQRNYERCLLYAMKSKNDTLICWSYNNLGNIFGQHEETMDQSIEYYKKAYDIGKRLNIPAEMMGAKLNIGWSYIDSGKFEEAYPYLKDAERYLKMDSNTESSSQLNFLFGKYYTSKEQYSLATSYFQSAISDAEAGGHVIEASSAYLGYSELLKAQGKKAEAYDALLKHMENEDRIYDSKKIKHLEAANIKFELEEYQSQLDASKKERDSQQLTLEKSKHTIYAVSIGAIIMLLFLLTLFKTNRFKRVVIKELSVKNKELREAKEKAEALSRSKTDFFSTISHELRTPLYGVIGLTTLLMESKDVEKNKEYLTSLKFSGDYLLSLINDVLQLNKIDSNGVVLSPREFNIFKLVEKVIASFEYAAQENKNVLHVALDKNIPKKLLGDSVRISQILVNLIGNALKFTHNGNIWLSITHQLDKGKHRLHFSIKDDGEGIPKDKQEDIFNDYLQVNRKENDISGSGLGLAIVKRLLQLFGSEIKLESDIGEGATFTFDLLLDTPANCVSKEELEYITGRLKNRKVLIVDDNKINQVVTRKVLELQGMHCDVCDNGYDAISKVEENVYDLVLMDINMPDINGIETTRSIRRFDTKTPVIALTAVGIEELGQDLFEAGMNDFVLKPYEKSLLFKVVYKNITIADYESHRLVTSTAS
ncbi:response regulator [Sungkyunkwania multivorans]|uniref:histidine kinase n=1 Tax=Sungkyunkwania multivorans TaxID=1173618 RepID=A0ABW3CX67_9FLAO